MQPSELDTRRAALCCLAINQNCLEAVQRLFDTYRDLNFHRVVIPPFSEKLRKSNPEKLLIATAVDVSGKPVVYVAFKRSYGIADILHGSHREKLSVLHKNQEQLEGCTHEASGYFHEVFYDRLLSSVPSVERILQFAGRLTEESSSGSAYGRSTQSPSALRVVFCGHGTGGAISHMAMLTYLLSLSSMSSEDPKHSSIIRDILEDTDNLKSISFGAPLFCDESTISNINNTIGTSLGKHLFNFFSKTDPVPFLLLGVSSQEGEEKSYRKVRDKFSRALTVVGSLLDSAEQLTSRMTATEVGSLLDSAEQLISRMTATLGLSLSGLPNSLLKQLAHLHSELSSIDGSNPYGLFGSYVDVSSVTTTGQGDLEHLASQRVSNFEQVPYLEAHTMLSYFKALSCVYGTPPQSSVPMATIRVADPPEVKGAFMVILHGEDRKLNMARIEVTGRNLSLLLEKKCSISTLHGDRWSVIVGDDKTVCWETTSALTDGELIELEKSGRGSPATKIKVETTFGTKDFSEVQMRNTTEGSFAVEGLMHAVGKMVILADTVGSESLKQSFRSIREGVQTVARTAGIAEKSVMKMREILKNQRYTAQRKKELLDQGIFREICEELCEKPLAVEYDDSEQSSLIRNLDYLLGILQMVLSAINPIAGAAAIVVILGVKGIQLLVQYMRRSKAVELRTYKEISKFLYAQYLLQSTKGEEEDQETRLSLEGNHQSASNLGAVSIRFCEKAIYGYVERVGYENMTFSSELKYKIEVQKRMEARTRLIHAILKTYHKAKLKKVMAVVGMENAGKTTLINLLRRHYTSESSSVGSWSSDAETGFRSHTSDVQGYEIGKNYIAVDFPGVGGVDANRSETWKAFEKVSDLCIVMVTFSGDVDKTCEELRSTFAEKLCKRYILLVNQVDSVLKGKPGGKAWNEYSPDVVERLRNKYRLGPSRSNELEEDTVYMCCLNDKDLYEYDREQLKVRGILFGRDVTDRIFELLDVEKTEDFETFQ